MNFPTMKRYVMAIAVASGVLLAPQWACAAGLQGITVHSVLGQPLRAEIQVSVAKDELVGMTAYLASRVAFTQAGLRYSPTLRQLRFELENRADGAVIKVTSVGPINDPFVQFLLELSWPAGRVSREYTFLVDPPQDQPARPAVIAPAAPQPEAADEADAPAPQAPKAAAPALPPAAGEYVVKPGETLYRVARNNRYPGVTQEQMQLAIYLRNSGAFDGAITRLRAGAVLQIPPLEEVRAIPVSPRRSGSADSGTTFSPRPAPPVAQDDGAKKKTEATLKALNARETTLRKDVDTLQKQLETKNQNIAEMQDLLKKKQAEAAEQPTTDTPPPISDAPPIITPDAPPVPDTSSAPDVPLVPGAPSVEPTPGAEPDTLPVIDFDEPPAVESTPDEMATQDPPPVPSDIPSVSSEPPAVAPVTPPSPVLDAPDAADEGLGLLPWIAGGAVLLIVLGGVLFMRRRNASGDTTTIAMTAFDDPLSQEALSTLGPNSVFQETRGQTVDTGNSVVPLTHSGFTQGHGIDTGDEVDPVEEADVYIAYGRDEQALEILLDALQKNPHRTAIHAKLLEIYANRKEIQKFDTLASELYAQTNGQGVDWEKVVALGRVLEPNNPLYGGSGGGAASAKPTPSLDFSLTPADAETDMAAESPPRLSEDDSTGFASVTDPVGIVFSPTQSAPSGGASAADDDPLLSLLQEESVTGADEDMELMRQETGAPPAPAARKEPEPLPTLPAVEPVERPLSIPPVRETVDEYTATTVVDTPMDFDLGRQQEEAPVVPSLPPDAPVFAKAEDAGQKSLVDFDLDVPDAVSARQREAEMGESDVMAATSFMTVEPDDDMEFNVELTESTILGAAGGSGFDLSGLDLELGRREQQAAAAEKPATAAPPPPAPVARAAAEDSDVVDARRDEVNTKLDLAKAYEEMGDLEGARELLNEVVSEGASDQVANAREMLKRIK
ncbi:MAG: hypothetical protein LBJ59_01965 [Zoogloeaceae bacterium]|jgi:pilus assembly protein FimV|nr:hypothetical protein [Zoogloeaceae bacterium]